MLRGGYEVYRDTLNALTVTPDQSGFSRTTSDPSTSNFGQTWNVLPVQFLVAGEQLAITP